MGKRNKMARRDQSMQVGSRDVLAGVKTANPPAQVSVGAEAPKSAHQQRREAERAKRQRQRITRYAFLGVGIVALLAVIGYIGWGVFRIKPGEAIPIMADVNHIPEGSPRPVYNSDPPTSGPHYATPARAGFYDEAPLDETLVHNLEHGHIVMWYRCVPADTTGCDALKTQLKALMDRIAPVASTGTLKLVAAPRPNMVNMITLTSWGRLQRLDQFDEAAIQQFIAEFRNQAPEPHAE